MDALCYLKALGVLLLGIACLFAAFMILTGWAILWNKVGRWAERSLGWDSDYVATIGQMSILWVPTLILILHMIALSIC